MSVDIRDIETQAKTAPTLLTIENLSVAFGDQNVLEGLNLQVREGEFLVLVGPSGCGKSTLLNTISGLLDSSARIEGTSRVAEGKRMGYAFQTDALLPWYTASQNIEIGAELRGVPKDSRKEVVREMLSMMHLENVEKSYPHQLSGGMRQRIALARVLAYDADLILLDEPFGALDAFTRMALQDELLDVWQRTGKTMVLVTHDLNEALVLGTRIVVLAANPGRIELEVSNDEWPMPRKAEELHSNEAFLRKFRELWQSMMSVGAMAQVGEGDDAR